MIQDTIFGAKSRGDVIASVLSGAWRSEPPPPTDAENDIRAAAPLLLDSPVAPLVWWKFRSGLPEREIREKFQTAYRLSTLRAEMHSHALKVIFARVRAVGLEPILHKGWATAQHYSEPGLRSYSDIDLIVPPGSESQVLAALGSELPRTCPVDLSHAELEDFDTLGWQTLYERSRLIKLEGCDIRVLCLEHHLRSICIHCLKHGVESPLWLMDVAAAVEARPSDFDWDLCLGATEPQANWVRCAVSLAGRLLAADIPDLPFTLPGWLERAVLRRWSRTHIVEPPRGLAAGLSRGSGALQAMLQCWPAPSRVCVESRRRFTRVPVLHLQLKTLLATGKIQTFISQIPNLYREMRGAFW